ncbi:orotate phosphoribosyltransferase [Weissella halotolerans]|uniref:Orotate phosphoribosyltransferase n=1 Tax=Weissella halotolerans DSM 20190 TaxID=1123500 RepID=A0A0R2FQT4_9LACO|nr:orotate phosphoribosyltransferase [Weissella halotolerans]KRN30873.1 orotate phosphoribosyltransferase [Weissella halotolerans DSM 20190]
MKDYQTEVAKALLAIEAIKLSPQAPFTWASGIKSPIYTDNRKTIVFPEVRKTIAQGLAALIRHYYPTTNVVAGVATAGIPHAAWVADALDLPMAYVRSKPKDHGAGQQIEGNVQPGDQVVLIDDLISTGGSVLGAVDAVRRAGGNVLGVLSIFSYELAAADKNFAAAHVTFRSLTGYKTLIDVAKQADDLTDADLLALNTWRQDPQGWTTN